MKMGRALMLTCVVAALAGTTRNVEAQQVSVRDDGAQVLLTEGQALREVFPDAAGFRVHEFAPTAPQRVALENAVSVASVLLLTEATMTEIPAEKKSPAAEIEA